MIHPQDDQMSYLKNVLLKAAIESPSFFFFFFFKQKDVHESRLTEILITSRELNKRPWCRQITSSLLLFRSESVPLHAVQTGSVFNVLHSSDSQNRFMQELNLQSQHPSAYLYQYLIFTVTSVLRCFVHYQLEIICWLCVFVQVTALRPAFLLWMFASHQRTNVILPVRRMTYQTWRPVSWRAPQTLSCGSN